MKTALCSLLLLCSSLSLGQTVPQWKVVKTVLLNNQTAAIPLTTLFTPTENSVYRLSAYMSARNLKPGLFDGWTFTFLATDFVNKNTSGNFVQVVGGPPYQSLGAWVFTPLKGTPVTYQVAEIGTPPPDAEYALAFTIEQLK
jgi:hypothetical protein